MSSVRVAQTVADNDLRRLDKRDQARAIAGIRALEHEPKRHKRLSGIHAGYWSARAGRARIIFRIVDSTDEVFVVAVGLRREGDRADIYARLARMQGEQAGS